MWPLAFQPGAILPLKRIPERADARIEKLSRRPEPGRPEQGVHPWGGFEEWSSLIRGCLLWLGLPDPCVGREELLVRADGEGGFLAGIIAAIRRLDPLGRGIRAVELIEKAKVMWPGADELRAVLGEVATGEHDLPSPRSLGMRLHHGRGRVVGGLALDSRKVDGTDLWLAREVGAKGTTRTTGTSLYEREETENPEVVGNSPGSPDSPLRDPDLFHSNMGDDNSPGEAEMGGGG